MAGAVELAGLAQDAQLARRAFDPGLLFPDQKQTTRGRQALAQGSEQEVGGLAGLGQEQHGSGEVARRGLDPQADATRIAPHQLFGLARMPTPAAGRGQGAQQLIGRQAGQQQGAAKALGVTEEDFAARIHGATWRKKREL